MLHNKVLHRDEYTFEVFNKMVSAGNGVLSEAKYLIDERDRHVKCPHNRQNWREFSHCRCSGTRNQTNRKT